MAEDVLDAFLRRHVRERLSRERAVQPGWIDELELGLTDQVPVRAVFLTDGRSRTVRLGRRQIVLKHTTPKQMATAGRISATVIQALRWIGQRHVTPQTIATLRRRLSAADRQQLLEDVRYAPAWVARVLRSVAEPGG